MADVRQESNSWPEPAPDWPKAIVDWQFGWPLHVYGFASVNLLVAIYAFFILLKQRNSSRKLHAFFINSMLLLFGLCRSVVLFWDPYVSKGRESKAELIACVIGFGVGTAALTSALSLLLLLLLDTTRTSFMPSKVQNLKFLLGVTLFNLAYILVADIIVTYFPQTRVLILICQVGFAVWGSAVSIGFVVVAYRLWRNLKSSRQVAVYNQQMASETKRIKNLVRLMYAVSFCTFAKFVAVIYVAISESLTFAKTGELDSWTWLALQSVLRATELMNCCFIFVMALRAKKNQNSQVQSIVIRVRQLRGYTLSSTRSEFRGFITKTCNQPD